VRKRVLPGGYTVLEGSIKYTFTSPLVPGPLLFAVQVIKSDLLTSTNIESAGLFERVGDLQQARLVEVFGEDLHAYG